MRQESCGVVVGTVAFLAGAAGLSTRALAQHAALVGGVDMTSSIAAEDVSAAYRRELISDAAGRASFAEGGGDVAGWDSGGFFVGDGGNNKLVLGGATQFRYVANFADEAPAGREDLTNGFEFRRTRMIAGGTIWSKDLSYKMQLEMPRNGGNAFLLEMFGSYKFDSNWSTKFGQYILGLLREESTSPFQLQTLDRALVTQTFAQGYSQGAEIMYTGENIRARAAYSDGLRSLNTEYTDSVESDYAFTLRGEARWGGGEWKRFNDISSFRNETYAGLVAGAVHYQSGGETNGTADVENLTYVADVVAEGSGWSAWAEFIGRRTETPSTEFDDFGAIVQGGYFLTDQIEGFARFEALFPDGDRTGGSDDFYMGTLGANYFVSPNSQAFKLTGEVNMTFSDVSSSASLIPTSNSVNLLPDTGDNQLILRLGAQILF